MGKKKKSDGYTSKGERRNVSKWVTKAMKKEVPPIVTLNNKWKAYKKGRNVMLTIPNPNAKEVWRNPNEVYMMKS